jgi:tryptophan 2,3-dioxygenase
VNKVLVYTHDDVLVLTTHRCSEAELRNIFTRFGAVQTCIVNKDKRHAFVKMLTRKDAISAKEGSEDNRGLEIPLRVCFDHVPMPC